MDVLSDQQSAQCLFPSLPASKNVFISGKAKLARRVLYDYGAAVVVGHSVKRFFERLLRS
jgi:hypothetical protein